MTQHTLAESVNIGISNGHSNIELAQLVLSCPDLAEQKTQLSLLKITQKLSNYEINQARLNLKCLDTYGQIIKHEGHLVEAYCKKYNLQPQSNGKIHGTDPVRVGSNLVSISDLDLNTSEGQALRKQFNDRNIESYCNAIYREAINFGFNQFSKNNIELFLKDFVEAQKIQIMAETISEIEYSSARSRVVREEDLWNKLYDGAFDHPGNTNRELVIAVIQNFIHSVKRKMIGKLPSKVVMPLFCGPQGTGKSFFIETLISPLSFLSTQTTMAELGDIRSIDLFSNYVGFVDEMTRGDRTEWNGVKRNLTSPTVEGRILGTSRRTTITNNISCIGATNNAPEYVIGDETGGRRFFGIYFTNKTSKELREIRDFVYQHIVALWNSVNENEPSPLLKFEEEFDNIIEEKRTKSDVELWLSDVEYSKEILSKESKRIIVNESFNDFKRWAETYSPKSSKASHIRNFIADLKRLTTDGKIEYRLETVSKRHYLLFDGIPEQGSPIENLKDKKQATNRLNVITGGKKKN